MRDFHGASALVNPTQPSSELSLDELDTGAVRLWMDWSRFNAARVLEWAKGLRAAVRSVAPCHQCTIKFNTGPAFPVSRVINGIDRPARVREMDISG